jgi:hypothetical protein
METMEARTIYEQIGWVRHYPEQLCQETFLLEKVYEYDFDLNDLNFREYLEKRGIASFKSFEKGLFDLEQTIDFLMNWDENRVLTDPSLSESITGLKFDEHDRAISLRVWKIQKGKLQDAWEIYKSNETF